jgi:hypothetical protein
LQRALELSMLSLSHLAQPFPLSDPLYGLDPDER